MKLFPMTVDQFKSIPPHAELLVKKASGAYAEYLNLYVRKETQVADGDESPSAKLELVTSFIIRDT